MKIIVLADIHSRTDYLPGLEDQIKEADLVVLSGDITNFGRRLEAERILDSILSLARQVLAVPGNCDYPEVAQVLDDRGLNLDGHSQTIDDIGFIGLGGSLPAPGGTPNEFNEDELGQRLSQAASKIDLSSQFILVSHQPPINTSADRIRPGQHVGSQKVRGFIEANQPLACLTGHIHEGVGVDQIKLTQVVNPGPLMNGRFATLQVTGDQISIDLHQV